ncbi:MAG: DUF6339 family protein [Dialister micraerophilus]|nr:DUF6339 family protein [Dialister micraerophilus]
MIDMKLYFITRNKIDEIKSGFSYYLPHYKDNDKNWFEKEFKVNGGLVESKFECDDFALDMTCENINNLPTKNDYFVSDLKNVKIMYNNLKDVLSPHDASDERLWTGLAHTCFWDFVRYRNIKNLKLNDDEIVKNVYFFVKNSRRYLNVNCLSRLWWAGYYTYDENNKENPYELTDFYFNKALPSKMLLLTSRNFISNKSICLGFIKGVKNVADMGLKVDRDETEFALKYLSCMGSVTLLDFLSENEIANIVEEQILKYIKKENKQHKV